MYALCIHILWSHPSRVRGLKLYRGCDLCANIVRTTHNPETKQGRIELCHINLERMKKLEQFCNDEQKAMILQAESAMNEM